MIKRIVIVAALAAAMLVLGIACGLWIASERDVRYSLVWRIEQKIAELTRSAFTSGTWVDSDLVTNRLTLDQRAFDLPTMVAAGGGGIAEAPGDGLLLLDRTGQMFHFANGQTIALQIETPDNGLDALTRQYAEGVLGKRPFHEPGFRFNDVLALERDGDVEVLISYSDWQPDRLCYRSVLAHMTFPGDIGVADWTAARGDWRVLKVTEPCIHAPSASGNFTVQGIEAGGRLVAVSDHEVVWSVGAYELDDRFTETGIDPYAQREDSDYGRLLKIDIRSGETEVLAKGLRNPQGLARSRDGRIWVTDHGMRGGDELNEVVPGRPIYNFGWPYVSYGTHYDGRPAGASGRHSGHEGYDLPVVAFVPSVAPGAVLSIEDFHPSWDGDILIGAFLRTIERVHVIDGRPVFVESISTGVRTRDLVLTRDGKIVIWTDNLQLIFLSPSTSLSAVDEIAASIVRIADDDTRVMVSAVMDNCLQCHGLSKGEIRTGPSLHGICGAQMGAVEGFDQYSIALASSRRIWTEDLLTAFIMDPQSVVAGTAMPWEGVEDPDAAAIVARLICAASE